MITKNNLNKLQQIITELNDWDALEICAASDSTGNTYYIPYMMNDSLEYYVILENCRIVGEFCSEWQDGMHAELINEADKTGLIVRQEGNSVSTIWFQSFRIVRQCYQYHRIGHFWVQGQEQWRQLVYMIGTMYDKQTYIGDDVCSKKEQELLPLMNFPPFLMWFPLNEVPWNKYPCTREGCDYMKQLALEAGDKHFARLISLYKKMPFPCIVKYLGRALTKPGRIPLYNLIYKKYAVPPKNILAEITVQNLITTSMPAAQKQNSLLRQKGFTGNYPFFQKDEIQIFAAEEHPFTVMESENFHFRIQYMVSVCRNPGSGINSGFFDSRKNESFIAKDLDTLF